MNIIKGEKTGNTFYRLQALQIDDVSDLVAIEAENPFAQKGMVKYGCNEKGHIP